MGGGIQVRARARNQAQNMHCVEIQARLQAQILGRVLSYAEIQVQVSALRRRRAQRLLPVVLKARYPFTNQYTCTP